MDEKRFDKILEVEEELICQLPMSSEWRTPAARALPWWFHHFITGRTVSNLGIVWPLQMSLIQFAHQQVLLERMNLDARGLEVARWMRVKGNSDDENQWASFSKKEYNRRFMQNSRFSQLHDQRPWNGDRGLKENVSSCICGFCLLI